MTEHDMTAQEARDLTNIAHAKQAWQAALNATCEKAMARLGVTGKIHLDYDLDKCVWKVTEEPNVGVEPDRKVSP